MAQPVLLERDAETEALRTAVSCIGAGSGRVVLIDGEAGVGKSSLLLTTSSLAAEKGLEELAARGVPVETPYAFGGVRQLFAAALRRLDGGSSSAPLVGPARVARRVLGLSDGSPPADEFAVHHGLYWILDFLAARAPLLLSVDDAQWLDIPSMKALLFIARRVADLPVLLAFAWRTGEPDPANLFGELTDVPDVARLAPRPLTRSAAASLLERAGRSAEADLVDACVLASGGNPFLLNEVIEALPEHAEPAVVAESSPVDVIRSVTNRLRRLPAHATKVARALTVLDGDADVHRAAIVAGVDHAEALHAVDELIQARLLADDAQRLTFRHPLLRAAVYRAMMPGERSVAHRVAAQSLAADPDTADRGAAHLLQVTPAGDTWVTDQLRSAAGRATTSGAPQTAITLLRRALGEQPGSDQPDLWCELGHAQLLAGDIDAVESLRRALHASPSPAVRAAAATDLCQALAASDRLPEAVATLRAELERLDGADTTLAFALRSLAVIGLEDVETASWTTRTVAELVTAGVPHDRYGNRILITHAYARALISDGPATAVAAVAEPALHPGWWHEHPGAAMTSLYGGLATMVWTGQIERAASDAAEVLRDAEQAGDLMRVGGACYWLSHTTYLLGKLADAEDFARRALEHRGPSPFLHRIAVAALLRALVARGRGAECEGVLAEEGLAGPLPGGSSAALLAYARIEAHLANGRTAQALDDAMLLGAFVAARGGGVPGWGRPPQEALRLGGRRDLAQTAAEIVLGQARQWGEPSALGVALCNAGRLAAGSAGLDRMSQGIALLERGPLKLELASALGAYGAAARRAGHIVEARQALERAVDLAQSCGAVPTRDEAVEQLRLTGARPRRFAITGVDALTPSEYRIARKAADGLSNTELCQSLFLTRSTVEKHLTAAFRKLGITSRDQLRVALGASAGDTHEPIPARS